MLPDDDDNGTQDVLVAPDDTAMDSPDNMAIPSVASTAAVLAQPAEPQQTTTQATPPALRPRQSLRLL